MGFSSVMTDGSSLPYEENIAHQKVVEYHKHDFTAEAELGVLVKEDDVVSEVSHYTKPGIDLPPVQAVIHRPSQ